ncbi:MAG: hypothetical protein AAGH43_10360 [Pseudomonadota bacterium]
MSIAKTAGAAGQPGYAPVLFLASLGAGGLAVTFFMYLMWFTAHAGQPIPSFTTLTAAFGGGGLALKSLIVVAMTGIAVFGAMHIALLVWNLRKVSAFRRTPAFAQLMASPKAVQIMAVPLTLAMTMNVGFILGAVFVPGLWEVVEFIFPVALAGFALIGLYALKLYLPIITSALHHGGLEPDGPAGLGQLTAPFAFSMVGVGFSAATAMSHNEVVTAVGLVGASFFGIAALALTVLLTASGLRGVLKNGISDETAPTLMIAVPIITVLGILYYRLGKGLDHTFGVPWENGEILAYWAAIVMGQLFLLIVGFATLRRIDYVGRFVRGEERSPAAYALICPLVAFFVSANFLIHAGMQKLGLFDTYSTATLAFYLPLIMVQITAIWMALKLNAKFIFTGRSDRPAAMIAAK